MVGTNRRSNLTAEQKFIKDIQAGHESDLKSEINDRPLPIEADAIIAQICSKDVGQVLLRYAQIIGPLNLYEKHIRNDVRFTSCIFDEDIDLTEMRADQSIEFIKCSLKSITARRLQIAQNLILSDTKIEGLLALSQAHIASDFVCSESHIKPSASSTAIDADELTVDGNVFLDTGFHTEGVVRLSYAHIKGEMNCTNARFHAPGGGANRPSLDATHLRVEGDLVLDSAQSTGEINVQWAHLRSLVATNAKLKNPSGLALRADTLRADIGVYLNEGFTADGGVRFVDAVITGQLCCTGGIFNNEVGRAVEGERLRADDIYMDRGFVAHGEVRLAGATVSRQLCCTGGRFNNEGGYAIDADGLDCRGEVFLNTSESEAAHAPFLAHGEVRLVGAQIGRELNCTGGIFKNPNNDAINADGLTTPGNIFLNKGFQAEGAVYLARATIGRQLKCTEGTFHNPDNAALDLSGAILHGDVLLNNEFRATGEVRMLETSIDRDLNLDGGRLISSRLPLNAQGMTVGATFTLKLAQEPDGPIDLSLASVQRLDDKLNSWPEKIRITEFTYRTTHTTEMRFEDRKAWLERTDPYSFLDYRQLSAVYKMQGEDKLARDTTVLGLRMQRKRSQLSFHRRVWNSFLYWTVGYGYKPYRALAIFLFFGALGSIFYHEAEHEKIMMATSHGGVNDRCPDGYPCFQPIVYAFETLIPVVNLRQITYWLPDTSDPWGLALMIFTWFCIVLGWLLGIALTAGVTRLFQRQ